MYKLIVFTRLKKVSYLKENQNLNCYICLVSKESGFSSKCESTICYIIKKLVKHKTSQCTAFLLVSYV